MRIRLNILPSCQSSCWCVGASWQHLAIGDVMPAVPGWRDAFLVMDFTPDKMLLLGVPIVNTGGAGETPASAHAFTRSWVHVLEETPDHHTRLITRGFIGDIPPLPSPNAGKPFLVRFATPSELLVTIITKLPRPVMVFFYRLVHFIMDRRHLVGIKQRAERQALIGSSSSEERHTAGIGAA